MTLHKLCDEAYKFQMHMELAHFTGVDICTFPSSDTTLELGKVDMQCIQSSAFPTALKHPQKHCDDGSAWNNRAEGCEDSTRSGSGEQVAAFWAWWA